MLKSYQQIISECQMLVRRIKAAVFVTGMLSVILMVKSVFFIYINSLGSDAFMMPRGYANSIIVYIPASPMFPEVDYEPKRSCPYFGQPMPFDPGIEDSIRKDIRITI